MIILDKPGHVVDGVEVQDFYSDAMRVHASYTLIQNIRSKDTLPQSLPALATAAHRDHIQLVPQCEGLHNRQYAAAELNDVAIAGCHLWSPNSQCQGVFMSDGFIRDLFVYQNTMHLGSQHKISINGLHSGYMADNRTPHGELLPILLQPLRIAASIWVIGFSDPNDDYRDLCDIIKDDTLDHVTDHRRAITRPNAVYLTDFDLAGYRAATACLSAPDALTLCAQLEPLALEFGRRVYAT